MKQTTLVKQAVAKCYDAFVNYAFVAQGIPVKPKTPQVQFHAGKGWHVDGRLFEASTAEVITFYENCANHWRTEAAHADK
ncbi:MAG: hypothetical protein ABI947_28775 [Chloroflexota bacterium]